MRKATVITEGNGKKEERFLHELRKLVKEANREPEFEATVETARLEDSTMNVENAFAKAGEGDD